MSTIDIVVKFSLMLIYKDLKACGYNLKQFKLRRKARKDKDIEMLINLPGMKYNGKIIEIDIPLGTEIYRKFDNAEMVQFDGTNVNVRVEH